VRDVQNRSGFRIGISLDVGVVHRCPETFGQRIHCCLDLVVRQRIQHFRFCTIGEVALGELVGQDFQWAALFGAVSAHPPVVEDPEEPRLDVAVLLERVKARVCVQKCVLQQIFGVCIAACQPASSTHQHIEEGLRFASEAGGEVGFRLGQAWYRRD
jgi:hypothetical protein